MKASVKLVAGAVASYLVPLLCNVALLLLAAPARAQIALVDNELTAASTFDDSSTALLLATNLTVSASANTLVVVVTFRNASSSATEAPSTLSWTNATTTNTLTLIVQQNSKAANGGRNAAIYYCYNPTAGTGYNISGKLSGQLGTGSGTTSSSGALVAYTLRGVDTSVAIPPSGSASGSPGGASLSFSVGGITTNSWAAVGGADATTSGISITATNSGVETGTPVLTTTNGGFSSTTTATMGYISGIAGGSDTFTMTNTSGFDTAFSAAVFSPPSTSPPTISSQPQSELIYAGVGATAQFTVQASGQAPLSYQWYATSSSAGALTAGETLTNDVALSNGLKYSGATSATLSISNVVAGDLTNYAVIITNSLGSITSSIATLAPAPAGNQQSNVISVNFTFTTSYDSTAVTLAPLDVAGAVPVTNWNNYVANSSWPAIQGTGNLQDSGGANTGAGLVMSGVANGWYNTASTTITSASTPDAMLLYNAIILRSGNTDTYTFTNLPAIGNYDVYVYLSGQDTTDQVQVQCTNSGVTYYQTELGQAITNNQALVQGNNTTSGTYPDCNYVVFGGVTPAVNSITLVVPQSGSSVNAGVAGVQLMPSGTTYLGFIQEPQPVTVPAGQNATFSVNVAGNPAASSYQWYEIIGGATNLIAGANASSYTATAATTGAGYFVVVGNGGTTVTSSVAGLVLYISTTQPSITTAIVTGGMVSLSWPLDHTGWILQVQTNSVAVGLGTNWVNVTDSAMTNRMVLPVSTGNGCVFYRLVYPTSPIDRCALVTRHNIQLTSLTGTIPLGNGEFCFNADGTGLQTFGGNTMSHWAWHSFPLPAGLTAADIPATGSFETGRVNGEDVAAGETNPTNTWMQQNPHIMNLGRLQLCDGTGTALTTGAISGLTGTMNIWSGVQTSSYQVSGQAVTVTTCVHPALDAVVVRIQSALLSSGALQVSLDFPYPTLSGGSWVGNFSASGNTNTTTMTLNGGSRADFVHTLDSITNYYVSLAWSSGGQIVAVGSSAPNRFLLSAPGVNTLEFVCVFSNAPVSVAIPTVTQALMDTTNHWTNFWSTGGAIDLSASTDSRWFELERRIVLSEYELAAQDAGNWGESEEGLMGIDPWVGQFHMEMLWWHLAHYALWNRWSMLTNALPYQRFVPIAQELATQLDYAGLKWGKEVGPEGRTAPWIYNQVLLWKQPHPIFFAELDYRLHPTLATLDNWSNIVFGTADNMADYADLNTNTGIYNLSFDVPPSENGLWSNTVFDLAYWRWGLNQAQVWRERLGLARNPVWDQVLTNLAPLPVLNGVFINYAGDTSTYTTQNYSHPDPIGVYGMLPPIEGVDTNIAHSTVLETWNAWDWNSSSAWGWDFPWMAMAAARTGEPEIAIDALMDNSPANQYDTRGVCNGWYLPGNGGLLYAVAMMAAGWDGSSGWAPGFPNDGSWTVKWEGLNKAP